MRAFLVLLAGLAVACGGGNKGPDNPGPPVDAEPEGPPTKDEIFEYQKDEIETVEGMRFQPQALGVPGMWKISVPKRATLKKQRRKANRKSAKVPDKQVLAALAWTESSAKLAAARKATAAAKKEKLEKEAEALRQEALKALREAVEIAGGQAKADEVTLKLLSVAEMTLGNETEAKSIYGEIATRFPPKAGGPSNAQIWLANLHLRADELDQAAKVVEGWKVAEGFDPMAAYVLGWVQFRQRDYSAAAEAMLHAAKDWKSAAGSRAVSNDVLLFLSRGGTPVAAARAGISDLLGQGKEADLYRWLYNLSKGYEYSGYPNLARETLTMLLSGEVLAEIPPRDVVAFRAEAAYDALKAGDPAACAADAIKAHEELANCGDACAQAAPQVTKAIQTYATLFHTLYAHSLDESYYEPAKKLYDYYLAIPNAPEAEVLKGYASRLADTKANADPSQGKHDKDETLKLVKLRLSAIKACYEAVLQGEPSLAGDVKLTLNIADTGEVSGVETDPAKGEEGLAAVAGCLDERVRTFSFPGRTLKGTTALVLPLRFAPQKEKTGSPAPAAGGNGGNGGDTGGDAEAEGDAGDEG